MAMMVFQALGEEELWVAEGCSGNLGNSGSSASWASLDCSEEAAPTVAARVEQSAAAEED